MTAILVGAGADLGAVNALGQTPHALTSDPDTAAELTAPAPDVLIQDQPVAPEDAAIPDDEEVYEEVADGAEEGQFEDGDEADQPQDSTPEPVVRRAPPPPPRK